MGIRNAFARISSKCMIGVWIQVNPPQDDLYQRSVSLVLGLQEFGLLMVGRRLWRHLGTPKVFLCQAMPSCQESGLLLYIICFVLLEIKWLL